MPVSNNRERNSRKRERPTRAKKKKACILQRNLGAHARHNFQARKRGYVGVERKELMQKKGYDREGRTGKKAGTARKSGDWEKEEGKTQTLLLQNEKRKQPPYSCGEEERKERRWEKASKMGCNARVRKLLLPIGTGVGVASANGKDVVKNFLDEDKKNPIDNL